jgi:GntR family transcriptional regulator/MocR family aminotransferase
MQQKLSDNHRRESIQHQIYDRVKQAILRGQLLPGHRIPPVRSLAADLGVARGTVVSAYRRLAGEGFVVASGPSGTRVAPHVDLHVEAQRSALATPAPAHPPRAPFYKLLQGVAPYPLLPGVPALDAFPRKLWVRLVGRAARAASIAEMSYPDPQGLPALRRA